MIDYRFKSSVMSSGIYNDYIQIRRAYYADYLSNNGVKIIGTLNVDTANTLALHYLINSPKEYKECERIYNSSCKRTSRLRRRISDMLTNNDCVFVTLTFTDYVLNNTNYDTRRKYVCRFLKMVSNDYVANIDFGEKNGRVHYHAVVVAKKINPLLWDYGACNVKKIVPTDLDAVRLSKYINKLTNHAIKDATKRYALIYSRKKY